MCAHILCTVNNGLYTYSNLLTTSCTRTWAWRNFVCITAVHSKRESRLVAAWRRRQGPEVQHPVLSHTQQSDEKYNTKKRIHDRPWRQWVGSSVVCRVPPVQLHPWWFPPHETNTSSTRHRDAQLTSAVTSCSKLQPKHVEMFHQFCFWPVIK